MEGSVDTGGMSVTIGCHRATERHSNGSVLLMGQGFLGIARGTGGSNCRRLSREDKEVLSHREM